jgi:signal transduction histidine kinase
LMRTADQVTKSRDIAEEASQAKSEFLLNMSHELRTPLNAIMGFSDIIREQTFGPVGSIKYREYARDINDAGRHLLELINDVLDFSKIESGNEELYEEWIDVHDAIRSVTRMLHDQAQRSDVNITVGAPDELPPLYADEKKIRQILINLLSNALKFTDQGGTVTLTAWYNDSGGYVIQVEDTGIGIALKDIPKALGLFGQVDSAFNRRYEGTGLGLPLSKSLAEMHGGSLDIQSQVDVGTTVTVRLPTERVVRKSAETL